MAQRDYEDQPEAPDLGAAVQLDTSDTLAGPAGDVDGLDAGYVPPDRPYALDDDGVTVAGQRTGETLDERLAREQPEDTAVDVDRAGRLADPEQLGMLERTDDLEGQDVGIDGGAASAEEAAVHIVDLDSDQDVDLDSDQDVDLDSDQDEGEPNPTDDASADALTADPEAGAARVNAVRDMRATDEGSAQRADGPDGKRRPSF